MRQSLPAIAVSLILAVHGLASAADAVAGDGTVRVAVASNFSSVAESLQAAFEATGETRLSLSAASTGKLYAQISNRAPFDLFLAADAERPARLEQAGLAVPGSRFTYAEGRLVLWSRDSSLGADECLAALRQDQGRIAIANPRTAPYGAAAREVLIELGLWEAVASRLVFGENISQTLQFAASGGARLGFVAASQLNIESLPPTACAWEVPSAAHRPILQQAVLLTRASDQPGAAAFLEFLKSETGRAIIARNGYRLADID